MIPRCKREGTTFKGIPLRCAENELSVLARFLFSSFERGLPSPTPTPPYASCCTTPSRYCAPVWFFFLLAFLKRDQQRRVKSTE